MKTFFKLDETHLNNRLRTLIRLEQKSRSEMLKQEMRLMLEMAVRMTAPFKPGQNAFGPLGRHKRVGERAVGKDLDSAFIHNIPPDYRESWIKAQSILRSSGEGPANEFLRRMGQYRVRAADVATERQHNLVRRSGKVNRRKPRFLFILPNEGALKSLLKAKLKEVGKTKAGWAPAAIALGSGPKAMPSWIRRHMGKVKGVFIEQGKGGPKERYQARNQVVWVAENPNHRSIEMQIYKHRTIKLDQRIKRMKKAVADGWKRSKRK